MANCCNYNVCQELATIGYIKQLVPSDLTCIQVPDGPTATTCCGSGEGDGYIPKLSEISGNSAPLELPQRYVDPDPSKDKNGFKLSSPHVITSSCVDCGAETIRDNEALMRSQVAFEYTEATLCQHFIITSPTICNPNYKLQIHKEWNTHNYVCNTGVTEPPYISATTITPRDGSLGLRLQETTYIESSLTRSASVTVIDPNIEADFTISTEPVTIESEASAQCNSKSASTTFSTDSNVFKVKLNCPDAIIPCTGGWASVTVSGTACECGGNDPDCLCDVTVDFEAYDNASYEGQPISATGWSPSGMVCSAVAFDEEIPLQIGENLDKKERVYFIVKVNVGAEGVDPNPYLLTCNQEWEICGGYSPEYVSEECNVLSGEDNWNLPDRDIIVHQY